MFRRLTAAAAAASRRVQAKIQPRYKPREVDQGKKKPRSAGPPAG